MSGLAAVEAQIGSEPPAGLTRLSDEELNDLATAIRDARRRQAAEIEAAAERALGYVPRLLRGPLRKVVG
jgi:hypothetical protein